MRFEEIIMALGIQKNSLDLKNQAATKIQSKFRGHFARLKIDALKRQEFKCPIKQDWINYDNSTLTKCHHIFDTHSLSQWIDQVTVSKLSIVGSTLTDFRANSIALSRLRNCLS